MSVRNKPLSPPDANWRNSGGAHEALLQHMNHPNMRRQSTTWGSTICGNTKHQQDRRMTTHHRMQRILLHHPIQSRSPLCPHSVLRLHDQIQSPLRHFPHSRRRLPDQQHHGPDTLLQCAMIGRERQHHCGQPVMHILHHMPATVDHSRALVGTSRAVSMTTLEMPGRLLAGTLHHRQNAVITSARPVMLALHAT